MPSMPGALTHAPHAGIPYVEFLKLLADTLEPASYLEIGTNEGGSLTQIECDCICIDPEFKIPGDPLAKRRRNFFFQMTSDDFFTSYKVRDMFPSGPDLVFLDGMHWFEYLLRDFINAEACCHRRSLILMHDCLPINTHMAERVRGHDPNEDQSTRMWWTGDVWRMLPILGKYRPDLQVRLLDCPPTGLVAISNLNPADTALTDNYAAILDEFTALRLEAFGIDRLLSLFPVMNSRDIGHAHVLTSIFTIR